MPSWNRREKPDYRHLRDVTDEAALANAIRCPTYGERDDYRLLAGFQARLLAMWGDWDALPLDGLVPAHEAVRATDPGFFGYGRHWQGPFLHDAVGNLVGWGLRLGILQEVSAPGGRTFRMVRRDPLFERMGNGRYRRLDAEGVREASARGAAQREAYRVRHAETIAPDVARMVGILCDRAATVPDASFTRFPGPFAPVKGLVERVADARPTFEQAHRGLHLDDQKRWVRELEHLVGRTKLTPVTPPPAWLPAPVPEEDVEALGSLA